LAGWDVQMRAVVEQATALVSTHGREDLTRLLDRSIARLDSSDVQVLVVGQFKQGKSRLINAIVNAPVCPVDDDIATSVPIEVAYGESPSATLLLADDDSAGTGRAATAVTTQDIPIEELTARIAGRIHSDGRRVVGARARIPREVLRSGVVLVDTPGTGGVDSFHTALTMSALETAGAVLFVTDASSEFTAPEMAFLHQALSACPTVICVLTKTDLYPDWRRVLEINEQHLRTRGVDAQIVPVSAQTRLQAAATADRELNESSGFPQLMATLARRVLGHREQLLRASTRHDVTRATDALVMTLTSEQEALTNPEALPEITASLAASQQRAEELKRRSARWQTTLSDGVADLASDLDYDLRDRLRRIVREVEEAIDAGDPGEAWETFAGWMEDRCADAVAQTFRWTEENASWLVEQVGQHFTEDARAASPTLALTEGAGMPSTVQGVGALDDIRMNLAQKIFIGMRGSYGGVLMTGLMTGLAGLALVNPISIGAGLLLGTKAYREDAQQRLKRRRSDAKSLMRKYADDVVFYVGKQLRDHLREIQRIVREYYVETAEAMSRTTADSVRQARRAAEATATERLARLEVVSTSLAEIESLRRAADALVRDQATSGSAAGSTHASHRDDVRTSAP
jgi:predicted GTPase